ncbi:zeta toxin family protein [Microbacterium flavum]|uniref:UDP-N-acetylglucosamine kinase n=1 Tax=Microbacterium flavum TaxID=415216 RepID=A0ABS5XU91_9MICO|nr:zeta toxin family protein [Microbacterium flavum]MBT8797482.1 zeta toxin family protein [Microbacterium flavum]
MTGWELDSSERDAIQARDVLPLVFQSSTHPEESPSLTLLAGQPGTARERAIRTLIVDHDQAPAVVGADDLRAFHPRFAELSVASAPESLDAVTRATAVWMRDCIRYARENKRSLVLGGAFQDPAVAVATTERFAAAGFQTRVVIVASRRAESLLSVASLYLANAHAGKLARLVSREAHDRAFEATRALAEATVNSASVSRLTVIGRDGNSVFDAHRADGDAAFVGGVGALESEQAARLSRFDATQWLSELHHATDFALTRRDLPRGVTELLFELHEVALREVIPELYVPSDGKFVSTIERKTAARLSELQRSLPREQAVDLAAPVISPKSPERGGISR